MPDFYIATPSFNSEKYISSCIESVITQAGDFTIFYHIQDGGSKDATLDIIENFARKIQNKEIAIQCKQVHFTWNSAPDKNMYDAINTAFKKLSPPKDGIMAWVNTDDAYLPFAFASAANTFSDIPALRWMGGSILIYKEEQSVLHLDVVRPIPPELLQQGCCDGRCWRRVDQASTFWKAELWNQAGELDVQWRYAADFELWPRFAKHADFAVLQAPLCLYRVRQDQLSEQKDSPGDITCYEKELECLISLEERHAKTRAFWSKRVFPPKGPVLKHNDKNYRIAQATAWPWWGQGLSFYKSRLRYYWRLVKQRITTKL